MFDLGDCFITGNLNSGFDSSVKYRIRLFFFLHECLHFLCFWVIFDITGNLKHTDVFHGYFL